jgi:hypothetical protein
VSVAIDTLRVLIASYKCCIRNCFHWRQRLLSFLLFLKRHWPSSSRGRTTQYSAPWRLEAKVWKLCNFYASNGTVPGTHRPVLRAALAWFEMGIAIGTTGSLFLGRKCSTFGKESAILAHGRMTRVRWLQKESI